MKNLFKYLDPFQLIGFGISILISFLLFLTGEDTIISILIGIALGLVTQAFDLQVRMMKSSEKLENLSASGTERIISSLGSVDVKLVADGKEFGQHLVSSLATTKKFVLDVSLTAAVPRLGATEDFSGFHGSQGEYHRLLFEKLRKQEISFYYVSVIFHRQNLESKIYKLLLHEGQKYYISHYEAPPAPIPIINMMSFDDEAFYLGGHHTKGASGASQVLYICEHHVSEMLKDYWKTLWDGAKPLNAGGFIDWDELKRIGLRLGMMETEFDQMVTRLREEVRRELRKFQSKK